MSNSLKIGSIGSISDIGGTVVIGGDIVQGDKNVGNKVAGNFISADNVTTGDITTGGETDSSLGFATVEAQKQFICEIEKLRQLIVDTKSQIELNACHQAGAEKLMQELSGVVKSLQEVKTQAAQLPVGQAAPPEKAKTLDDQLKSATSLIEKTQRFCEKVAELSIKLAPVALSLLNGVRSLLKI